MSSLLGGSEIIQVDHTGSTAVPVTTRVYVAAEGILFRFIYLVSYCRHSPAFLFYLYIVTCTLQLCRFLGDTYVKYQWTSNVAEVFMTICSFISQVGTVSSSLILFYLSWAFVIMLLVVSVISALCFSYVGWTKPYAVVYALVQVSFFIFLPVMSICTRIVFGCIGVSGASPFYPRELTCWEGTYFAYFFCALVLGVIFLAFTCLFSLTIFDNTLPQDLNGNNKTASRYLNRVESTGLLVKTALLVLLSCARDESWRVPSAALLFLAGGVMVRMHLRHMEIYGDAAMSACLLPWTLLGWGGFNALLISLIGDANATGMLFFAGLPVICIGVFVTVRARYTRLLSASSRETTSGLIYVLLSWGTLRRFLLSMDTVDAYVTETEEVATMRAAALQTSDEILDQGLGRFPNCATLHAYTAAYFEGVRHNRMLAWASVRWINEHSSSIDVRFRAFLVHMSLLQADLRHRSSEVERYLEFKNKKTLADAALGSAARQLVSFWSELLRSAPSVDTLATLGHDAKMNLAMALKHYDRLLELNKDSLPVLRTLGLIALNVTGELHKAVFYFDRADVLEKANERMQKYATDNGFLAHLNLNLDIFDDRNAVISVSVASDSFAAIESVNGTAKRLFGYTYNNDMVGHNISLIMPREVGALHDSVLRDFIARKSSRIVNSTRMTFGVNATSSFLIPIDLYVRFATEHTLVGVMRELRDQTVSYLMLDSASGAITMASKEFLQTFGFSRKQVNSRQCFLSQVVPILVDEDSNEVANCTMLSPAGLKTQAFHLVTGQPMNVHLWLMHQQVSNARFSFVKIVASQIVAEDASDRSGSDSEDVTFTSKFATALHIVQKEIDEAPVCNGRRLSLPLVAGDFSALLSRSASGRTSGNLLYVPDASPGIPSAASIAGSPVFAEVSDQSDADSHDDDGRLSIMPAASGRESVFSQALDQVTTGPFHLRSASVVCERADEDALIDQKNAEITAARHARSTRMQRQLRKAIHNDGRRILRRLRVMNAFTALVVAAMIIAGVVLFVLMDRNITITVRVFETLYASSCRERYMANLVSTLQTLNDVTTIPGYWPTMYHANIHGAPTLATVQQALRGRMDFVLFHFNRVTNEMARTTTDYAPLKRLQRADVLPTEMLLGSQPVIVGNNMNSAAQTFLGIAYHVVYVLDTNGLEKAARDAGYFYTVANGLQLLREASRNETLYLMDEYGIMEDRVTMTPVYVMLASVLATILASLFLVRPIVLRVEGARTHLLDIFMSIPRNTRRSLRTKVLHVHTLMSRDDEGDIASRLAAEEDEEDDGTPEPHSTGDEGLSDVSARYTNVRVSSGKHGDVTQSSAARTIRSSIRHQRSAASGGDMHDVQQAQEKIDLARISHALQAQSRAVDAPDAGLAPPLKASQSLLRRRTVQVFYLKYIFFLVLVGVYFGLVSWVTNSNLSSIGQYSSAVVYANRRYPSLQLALAAASWNALYDFEDMLTTDPNNGILRGGEFSHFARKLFKDADDVQRSLLFGGMGITRVESPEQDALLYSSPCQLRPERIEELGIWVDTYFWDNCYTVDQGVFAKTGLVGMWESTMDTLDSLIDPNYAGALNHMAKNETAASGLAADLAADLLTRLQKADEYLNYYLEPLLALSAAMYYEYAYDSIALFSTSRQILLSVYCIVLALYYLLILRPTGQNLNEAASKTQSLMLLLPADVVKHVPLVQKYIEKHVVEDA